MKTLLIFLALLACFGVVGRVDHESELAMAQAIAEYAHRPAQLLSETRP